MQQSPKYPNAQTCPVCEQQIEAQALNQRIEVRLQEMNELRRLKQTIEQFESEFSQKNAVIQSLQQQVLGGLQELIGSFQKAEMLKLVAIGDLSEDVLKVVEYDKAKGDLQSLISHAQRLYQSLQPHLKPLQETLDAKQKTVNQFNAIVTHLKTIQEKTQKARHLEKLIDMMEQMLKTVENERRMFVEEILANIAGEVKNLYEQIHPNENIGQVEFSLDPHKRASMNFEGYFHGQKVPPQAYFSDSHLDTLGMAIFLALAKYYRDENTIVVLDDVITSVDQEHMLRIMNMLENEAGYFNQMIVTTHYRPWRDSYRYGFAPSKDIHLLELNNWSFQNGIRAGKIQLSAEELHYYLQPENFNRQIVASQAGILLERFLDEITLRYECRVPRKADLRYTLGDLVHAINKKLKQLLSIEKDFPDGSKQQFPLIGFLDYLAGLTWIRNVVGCHFNPDGMQLPDSYVQELGERTLELASLLICDGCGEFPRRNTSGSYWECKCRRTKMHPLEMPN